MTKPLTILLITSDRLVRAEVRSGRRSAGCQVFAQPRPAVDDLPSLVEAALRLGSTRPRQVLLLSTELWTQTLPLAAGATGGMSEEEIAQALAFEAEPFSGISAFDSLTVCRALSRGAGEPSFWFTQLAASQLESIEYAIREAGGKLIGIGHPAGLPAPLSASQPACWQRIELWPEAVVCVNRLPRHPLQVHVINSGPLAETWQDDARQWLSQFDPPEVSELLSVSRFAAPLEEDFAAAEMRDLADEAVLEPWLIAWAQQAVQRHPEAPLLRPAPQPMPTSTRVAIAGLIAALMLVLCLGHYHWTSAVTAAAEERVEALQEPARELRELEGQVESRRQELAEVTAQIDQMQASVDACRRALEWNRQRIARLMAALAESDPDRLVIQAIETQREGIRIRGISRRSDQPTHLAARLASQLLPLGLQVHPPTKEAGFLLADGGPYWFDLLIQDIHHAGLPLPGSESNGLPQPAAEEEATAAPREAEEPVEAEEAVEAVEVEVEEAREPAEARGAEGR